MSATGQRDGITTAEAERIKQLEREVRELKQADEILRLASAFFSQAELDRRKKWSTSSSTTTGIASGSSRSARRCRSPRRRTGAMSSDAPGRFGRTGWRSVIDGDGKSAGSVLF
jgi:hypothetical protein